MENHENIKLVTTKKSRNYLASEPNYYTSRFFSENLLAIEMKRKTQIVMNKPLDLGLSILDLSQIVMYECMSFGMIMWVQNEKKKQKKKQKKNCAIWIQKAL